MLAVRRRPPYDYDDLRDPYDLTQGSAAVYEYPEPAPWSQVADALRARLERMPSGSADDRSARYARDGVMDRLRTALEKAGRADETIELLVEEARRAGSYPRYDRARTEKARLYVTDDAVAGAVAPTHPERAAQIWRELAAQQLKHADVRAYDMAARYLGRLRTVVPEPEWRAELEGLKATYRRRPRLVEAVDKVLQEP